MTPKEVRATWVVRTSIADEDQVRRVVADARTAGLNTLFVQVRGRGDAWYRSELEPLAPPLVRGDFDPLDSVLEHALHAGLFVHAWFNVNLVADAAWLPTDPRHVVNAHPEWLNVPAALSPRLLSMPPSSSEYRAALAGFARDNETVVEGLFADPAQAGWRRHLTAVAAELVARYPVDGLHLDYIRYPNGNFGATKPALEAFRREIDQGLSKKERQDLEKKLSTDPLAATKRFAPRWTAFRRAQVDRTVQELTAAVRAARPGIVVTAAGIGDVDDARQHVCQDWPRWLKEGWVDAVCPMLYAKDRRTFEVTLREAVAAGKSRRILAGIGSWQLDTEETILRVEAARRAGAAGVVLFSHGDLQKRDGAFEQLGKRAFR